MLRIAQQQRHCRNLLRWRLIQTVAWHILALTGNLARYSKVISQYVRYCRLRLHATPRCFLFKVGTMISAPPFISQHQRANWRQGTRHFTILKRSEGIVDRCGPLWTVVGCCGPLWAVVGMISRRPASFCQRKAVVCSHYPSLSQNDLHGCRNLHQSVQYSSMMFNELLGFRFLRSSLFSWMRERTPTSKIAGVEQPWRMLSKTIMQSFPQTQGETESG